MMEQPKEASCFWKIVKTGVRLSHGKDRIPPAPISENLPLSFSQERLWQVDHINPGNIGHNLQSAVRLKGPLDEDILKQSLEAIIKRHEILRTTFRVKNDDSMQDYAFQVVSKNVCIDFSVLDMNDVPVSQQQMKIKRIAAEEAQRPFNLATGPLIRMKLLRLWQMEWLLLRTIHHIVNDRWSNSIFMRELSAIYVALKEGKSFPLKALPIQYKDYAYFQRQQKAENFATTHIHYWKKYFAGYFPILRLPEDVVPHTVPTCRGGSEYLVLNEIFLKQLTRLSMKYGFSLYVILFSVFKILLFRYSCQKTMIISSPVASRNKCETKKLIGCFNNMILIKTEIKESLTFKEIMKKMDQRIFQVMKHQELPLQYIVNALGIPGAIISRCMFAFQNVPSQPNKMADVLLIPMDLEESISNFDLSLSFKKTGKGLTGVMRYKTDLFTRRCITGMLISFKKLLNTLIDFPTNTLKELPLLGDPAACKPMNLHRKSLAIPPESQMEITVANVWKEVLGLPVVDIKTSFFDLGGRSLSMVKVCGRLQQILNQEISALALFKNPTIKGIAEYLSQNRTKKEINLRPILKKRMLQKEAIKRRQREVLKIKRK